MAINAFVALCTSLSSFLQNMRYSTICSSYNGHFQAILQNTKIYKIQKKIPNVPQFAASTTDTSKRFYKIQKIQVFHNLQLLQRTLPSNFTKYKKVQKIHNLQLLQRTLPSNFTKYKKSTNIPQFAASVTDTSKQFYIVDILTTAISLGHVFCGRIWDCSHFSFHQSSLIMFSVDIVPWQPSRNMYVENLEWSHR